MKRIIVWALLLALLGWFLLAINTAAGQETQLVFEIDESLKEPKQLPVYVPTIVYNAPTPKKTVPKAGTSKTVKPSRRYSACSCVSYVKSKTGFTKSIGVAKNWPINSKVPQVGGVVITNESRVGHVAYIEAVVGSTITISEANYLRCKTSNRTLDINSPVIRGYYVN